MTSPVPPNPTTPTSTPPTGCAPGTYMECTCPGGSYGEQICGSDGMYGGCECYGGDASWGTSTSGWWGTSGSSGWWGSSGSSGGGWSDPEIPELRPGESCLALDQPCTGFFDVGEAELEAFGVCSRVEGDVFVHNVSTLEPLGCLREVEGFLELALTQVTTLSALSALEYAGGFGLGENEELITIDVPTLQTVDGMYVFGNGSLVSFDLPNLDVTGYLDIFNNMTLPDCEIQELAAQATPANLGCDDNLADMCVDVCG